MRSQKIVKINYVTKINIFTIKIYLKTRQAYKLPIFNSIKKVTIKLKIFFSIKNKNNKYNILGVVPTPINDLKKN